MLTLLSKRWTQVRLVVAVSAFGLWGALPATAGPIPSPDMSVSLVVDTGGNVESYDVLSHINTVLVPDELVEGAWNLTWSIVTAEFSSIGAAYLDPDPEMVYNNAVIDFGAASSFGFIYQQAIADTQAAGDVFHTYSASSTDGGNSDWDLTIEAPPGGISDDGDGTPEVAIYSLSTNGGATWTNVGIDLGPTYSHTVASSGHGPFTEVGLGPEAPPDLYDAMRVDVNFSLNGGNDQYTFNGRVTVFDNPVVPEPGTFALTALGLAGLAWGGRRPR